MLVGLGCLVVLLQSGMQMSALGSLPEDCEEMLRSILVRISLCTLGQHRMNSKIACPHLRTVIKSCGPLPLTTASGRPKIGS